MSENLSGHIRVTFDVFGTYTHGKLLGKVNPRESVRLSMIRKNMKQAKGAVVHMTDGAFYKIVSVDNL
jgi:hypothetical protein